MKRALAALIAAPLLLTGCSNAPDEISKPKQLNKWIESAGYDCASWKENSDTHAVCYLDGGDSLTVTITKEGDSPTNALPWYFDSPSIVGAVHGDNWFILCKASTMSKCGDIASAADVNYLPNPIYL